MVGFNELDLKFDSEIAYKYGKGLMPTSYSQKKFKQNGRIVIFLRQMRFLIEAANLLGGDIRRLPPLPAQASCLTDAFTFQMQIPGIKFKSYNYKWKEGDDEMEVPCDIEVVSYPIIRTL